jgi:hypothetical protein
MGYPRTIGTELNLTSQRLYKTLFEMQPIVMNSLGIEQNLVKDGNRRIVQDFRKGELNSQDLRTTRRTQE